MSAARRGIVVFWGAVGLAAVGWFLFSRSPILNDTAQLPVAAPLPGHEPTERSEVVASPFHFTLMTPGSGVDFRYYGALSPDAAMTEQNGGGAALLDFDHDGTLDLFFVNGSSFDRPASRLEESSRLFRATGDYQYDDATVASGLVSYGFGMGCAAGDFDNDGFTDLFVTTFGRDHLWINNGDGSFSEVSDAAGIQGTDWGTSAAFADFDGDGLLDLYVVNYVEWSPGEPPCHPPGHPEINSICSPMTRSGQADQLYRNLGDGRFEESGRVAGVADALNGKGLALAVSDFDLDGLLDVYVANDTTRNFLYHNLGGLRFEETGVPQGVAMSSDGQLGAGMGVGCADYDHNGWFDLCVTNFRNQLNDVFSNLGPGGFVATNTKLGLDRASRSPLGFGIVWCDFDQNSWPDLLIANGHIHDWTSLGSEYEFRMTPQILLNRDGDQFVDVSSSSGDWFQQPDLGRSIAVGDLDNDRDTDFVVTGLDGIPSLLRNDSELARPGVCVEFVGTTSARQPLGAVIAVDAGGERLIRQIPSGTSFQASHDPRVVVTPPVGCNEFVVTVQWPGGGTESWTRGISDRAETVVLIQGTGQTQADFTWRAE